jgi:hypothetical protein
MNSLTIGTKPGETFAVETLPELDNFFILQVLTFK